MEQKEKKVKFSRIVRVLLIPLLAFMLWYVFLPAINLHSFEFWIYLIINLLLNEESIIKIFGDDSIKNNLEYIKEALKNIYNKLKSTK